VSDLVVGNARAKLAGLLHDATEAYLVDVPRPVKNQLKEYKPIESNLHLAIAKRFNLDMKDFDAVKPEDEAALVVEAKSLMFPFHPDWVTEKEINLDEGLDLFLEEPWGPMEAELKFLEKFHDLCILRERQENHG
jgi:hypothetical protein